MSHSNHSRKLIDVPHFKHPSFIPWVQHLKLYHNGVGPVPDFTQGTSNLSIQYVKPRYVNKYEMGLLFRYDFECKNEDLLHFVQDSIRAIGNNFYKDLLYSLCHIRTVLSREQRSFSGEAIQCLTQLINETTDMSRVGRLQ